MKILSVEDIRKADAYTIEHEPIKSIDLMERAGKNCSVFLLRHLEAGQTVLVFVGPGNNGGDGLVVARHLHQAGRRVEVFVVDFTKHYSPDFRQNLKRLPKALLHYIRGEEDMPPLNKKMVVLDALFGSGLSRPVTGLPAMVIRHLNSAEALVVSLDIPSGLFADSLSSEKDGAIVHADITLSLQFPKYSFFFPEHEYFVGELHLVDIGLHPEVIKATKPKAVLLEEALIAALLIPYSRYAHKGSFGHALLLAGSMDKSGAALMASEACLRSGAGLLTTHLPGAVRCALQTYLPEAMLSIDSHQEYISMLPPLDTYSAVAMGPGVGKAKATAGTLKLLIQNIQQALVLDADALNLLADNKTWLGFLPPSTILTPHPGEFDRLFGRHSSHPDRLKTLVEQSKKFRVFIVLKGAHTAIACPDGTLYFNNTGNPGMATGGSGDVLTGVILALLAQHYSPHDALLIAVWIHGLAGDLAMEEMGREALLAADISSHLGRAFLHLRGKL